MTTEQTDGAPQPTRPARRSPAVVAAMATAALVAVPPVVWLTAGASDDTAGASRTALDPFATESAAEDPQGQGRIPPAAPISENLREAAEALAALQSTVGPSGERVPTLPAVTSAEPGAAARSAVSFAMAQLGLPYVWGGNGPQRGDAGFDCSGLTTAAYAYAGIRLPRTAHTQFYAGPRLPAGTPLQAGDLVFYGPPQKVRHVGMYLGEGRMVNAPTFGQPVRVAWVRYDGDDYIGATRPAAGGIGVGSGPAAVPTAPAPIPAAPPRPTPPTPAPPTNQNPPPTQAPPTQNPPPSSRPSTPPSTRPSAPSSSQAPASSTEPECSGS